MLEQRGGEVILIIEDDGTGVNLSEAQESSKGGLGLRSMRERVELLGGHFEIESNPGQGTSVFARLPLGQTEGG
jgi:signal transduction histidine kinase